MVSAIRPGTTPAMGLIKIANNNIINSYMYHIYVVILETEFMNLQASFHLKAKNIPIKNIL